MLVAGGIDISFTATASVAQYVAVSAAARLRHIGWFGLFAPSLAVGIALRARSTPSWSSTLRISSIIVTIATLNVFYGLLMFVTDGNYIYSLPDWLSAGIIVVDLHGRRRARLYDQPADSAAGADASR